MQLFDEIEFILKFVVTLVLHCILRSYDRLYSTFNLRQEGKKERKKISDDPLFRHVCPL